MSASHVRMTFLACALLLASLVHGAIHGVFPGITNLIGDSQAILVVSIESGPSTPRTDSSKARAVQSVRVLHVLKGNLMEQARLDVALDPFLLYPAKTYLDLADFPIYERYVLFIAKDSLSPR